VFKISASENVEIPPSSEIILPGKIQNGFPHMVNGFIEPLDCDVMEKGCLLAKSVVDPSCQSSCLNRICFWKIHFDMLLKDLIMYIVVLHLDRSLKTYTTLVNVQVVLHDLWRHEKHTYVRGLYNWYISH
jgi:hypothetical protein